MEVLAAYGELRPAELVEMAKEDGFSERTVYRARSRLGKQILDTQGRRHPNNTWVLPDSEETGA